MGEFDAVKYKNDWQKEKYDRIIVNVEKGKRSIIDDYRKEKGYSSLNAYINELIRRDMNGEKDKASNVHINNINQNTINMG